jgi:hypothetical protein
MDASALMQCCNAAGARAIYDLWRYAVDESTPQNGARDLRVNLRFSVESPALRVVSHEPAEGRLELTTKATSHVSVRLPEGVGLAVATIGGNAVSLPAKNGYASFNLQSGETADVRYDLPERIEHYEVGEGERSARATGYWRGETLLKVDPPGTYLPLYERSTDLAPVQPVAPAKAPIDSL